MAPKIFITGITGYIGGDAFYALQKAHPEYEYTAIIRNTDKGALVAASYPKTRLVYGTNDDATLIEAESARADIVIHTADSSDHVVAAKAIAKGIETGHSAENPGYWIHISGTGILCWKDAETQTFGEGPSQPPYDDLENVSGLTSVPDSAFHRDIDKIVLAANSESTKTAIVCPPTIYGSGRGPGNKRSRQVPDLAKVTLEKGQALQIGKGLTEWDNVHAHDLSTLLVLLVEAAIASKSSKGKGENDSELWGQRGYFLAENGHHVWGEVSRQIAEAAYQKGYIETKEVKVVSAEEAGNWSWGQNSKGFAKRARKFLNWNPVGKSLEDEIPDIVDIEAKAQGLLLGHAEKASGKN